MVLQCCLITPSGQISKSHSSVVLQLRVKGERALGFVALDTIVQRSLHLSNSGLSTASYRVEVEAGLPIQVTPFEGKLDPKGTSGSSCTLKLELTAEIAGPLSGQKVHQAKRATSVHCFIAPLQYLERSEVSSGDAHNMFICM